MKSGKTTKKITTAAMLSAVAVVFLYLGCLIEPLDLTMTVLASLTVIFAVIELAGGYPYAVWLVASAAAMLLLPSKLPALYFLCFAGIYPIVKEKFERLRPPVSWVLKLISFNAALTLVIFAVKYVFIMPDSDFSLLPLYYAGGSAVFILYDIALTRLISYYVAKLRARLKIKFD